MSSVMEKVKEVKLVEPWWKSFATKWSQKINSVVVLLPLAYASIPDKWQDALPTNWVIAFSGLGIAAFVARNLKQPKTTPGGG